MSAAITQIRLRDDEHGARGEQFSVRTRDQDPSKGYLT